MLEFGRRLKELRLSKKLKQADMADVLGITSRHYQEMEYGKVNVPATTLISLAQYFNVSSDYLLGLSDKLEPRFVELTDEQLALIMGLIMQFNGLNSGEKNN